MPAPCRTARLPSLPPLIFAIELRIAPTRKIGRAHQSSRQCGGSLRLGRCLLHLVRIRAHATVRGRQGISLAQFEHPRWSSMARSCRYLYEHDPFCSWRTLLRFARRCLFLRREALPVRGRTRTERRPAVPKLRNSVPIDASLYTRALLIRPTWRALTLIFARSRPQPCVRMVRLKGSLGSRIDRGRHEVAPYSAPAWGNL